jgi:hypothetical protein
MTEHKFVYTVSGVDLTDAQKAAISQGIGATVASVLIGASPQTLRSDSLNIGNIHGGKWILAELVADQTVGEFTAAANAQARE